MCFICCFIDDKEESNPGAGSSSLSAAAAAASPIGGLQSSGRNKAPLSPAATMSSATPVKTEPDVKLPVHALSTDPEEAYSLFMGSNNWYLFLRLHQILCERLTKMYERAVNLAEDESRYRSQRKESAAIALRLKPRSKSNNNCLFLYIIVNSVTLSLS